VGVINIGLGVLYQNSMELMSGAGLGWVISESECKM
jgi:hypothetical protein